MSLSWSRSHIQTQIICSYQGAIRKCQPHYQSNPLVDSLLSPCALKDWMCPQRDGGQNVNKSQRYERLELTQHLDAWDVESSSLWLCCLAFLLDEGETLLFKSVQLSTRATQQLSLALYVHSWDQSTFFTLRVYFLTLCMCNSSDCGVPSVLCLNTSCRLRQRDEAAAASLLLSLCSSCRH